MKWAPGLLHAFQPAAVLWLTEPRSGRKLDHDAVRAQLDLPDFFENLAGNHFKEEL